MIFFHFGQMSEVTGAKCVNLVRKKIEKNTKTKKLPEHKQVVIKMSKNQATKKYSFSHFVNIWGMLRCLRSVYAGN